MIKKIFALSLAILFIFAFSVNCFAYSASTYSDLAQSSTQANNLIALAENYNSFEFSDFVVAQIGQYEYRIFWGDLDYNGSSVSGSEVEYLQYIREGSGYDYSYYYYHGTDSTLSLSINNLVVSNIDQLGSRSALYEEFEFYDNSLLFFILLTACAIALLFLTFRSTHK